MVYSIGSDSCGTDRSWNYNNAPSIEEVQIKSSFKSTTVCCTNKAILMVLNREARSLEFEYMRTGKRSLRIESRNINLDIDNYKRFPE